MSTYNSAAIEYSRKKAPYAFIYSLLLGVIRSLIDCCIESSSSGVGIRGIFLSQCCLLDFISPFDGDEKENWKLKTLKNHQLKYELSQNEVLILKKVH